MDHVLHIISWLGFPTLLGLFTYLAKRVKALDCGLQAMLRDRLRFLYKSYKKRGSITYDEKEDWIYMYNQYHALGKNGVMDSVKDKILAMETKEED
jgi:hypothetical protein